MMSCKKRNRDTRLFDPKVCAFCGQEDDNEVLYGKLIVGSDITVHSNCMFFASGLGQEGEESEGIVGFLLPDIESELRRGKKLFCSYCRKRGATIGCSVDSCKKSFHLNCGREHGSLHQFFGSFCSFCQEHSPKQKKVTIEEELYCYICCENISSKDLDSCLYSPCCKKNWFHKICIQKYALSAGLYFFKCPLCNNSKEFVKEMEVYGISIPDKDASWELEENAYQELLSKPECDATVCLCSRGRQYCAPRKSGWTLMSCSHCGYHARHKKCENIKLGIRCWICEECKILETEIEKKKLLAIDEVNKGGLTAENEPSCSYLSMSPALADSTQNNVKISDFNDSNIVCASASDLWTPSLILQDCLNINAVQSDNVSFSSPLLKSSVLEGKNENIEVSNTKESVHHTSNSDSHTVYNLGNLAVNLNKSNCLKDIKNFDQNSVAKRLLEESKTKDSKRNVKKQKISSCCGKICIKKYFGQNCGKYRL